MKDYRFYRTGRDWYIDLPEFLIQGGSIGDLQMVDGADYMLDMMAGNENEILLTISAGEFEGADSLQLTEKCDPYIGGAYYLLANFEGQAINKKMWLCQVTEFVFGYIPEQLFVKRHINS